MRLSGELKVSGISTSKLLTLPEYILEDIFNRLAIENASNIASAVCVCKNFKEAGTRVRSVRLICLNRYHEAVRAGVTLSNFSSRDDKGEASTSTAQEQQAPVSSDEESSGDEKSLFVFRNVVVDFLKGKPLLLQIRIEIEAKLQSKLVPEGERRRTDFWLSDPFHLIRWVPSVRATLQHLCIVDYGQQAIMRRTNILKILSQNCKVLKTLDLRNMFIDSTGLEAMPTMKSFTVRCVKVTGDTLQLVNTHMRNLTTLILLGVFGVTRGTLDFPHMKVLCLGLSTMAKDVSIQLPKLEKLQLKMLCPESLSITDSGLKFMAFNLEVRETSRVELQNLVNLQELLYGTSSFDILSSLVAANTRLEKLFLDIPCMALGEDGKWLGVLQGIPFNLPSFHKLLLCQRLDVLNIGPGLWHSMEVNVAELPQAEKWPPVKRLILHMIPQNLASCLTTLNILLRPTLVSLEIYVHTGSPISYETIETNVSEIVSKFGPGFSFQSRHWTRSLDFSCFSF